GDGQGGGPAEPDPRLLRRHGVAPVLVAVARRLASLVRRMTRAFDQPSAVRPGQGFDAAALGAWLRAQSEGDEHGFEGDPQVSQFGRGYSNLTYLVRFGARELVVRRAPPGVDIRSAHDMAREFRILSALAPAWPKVPAPVAYCDDPSVLGTRFYV